MDKVYTRIVIDMETLEVISREGYDYIGPWEYAIGQVKQALTGSNPQTTANATEDEQFQQTLQNAYNTTFAGQQAALNTVNSAMAPIVAGGEYQYGYGTAENAAMQSEIENAGATATTNSIAAQQLREQQQAGGAGVLPSGAQAALESEARTTGAQSTAAALNQQEIGGYEVGRQNFQQAVGAEEQVAQLENPTGVAGAASEAEGQAINAQNQVNQLQSNSLTGRLLGGGIGGAITSNTGTQGGTGTNVLNFLGSAIGG
jgi:hypothetical protein